MIRNFRRHVKEQQQKPPEREKSIKKRDQTLQKKMKMIYQENTPEVTSTQSKIYQNFYKELIPILRLFYFLKNSHQLKSEIVLEQFKQTFFHYKNKDNDFQKQFDNPEEHGFNGVNRVSQINHRPRKSVRILVNF